MRPLNEPLTLRSGAVIKNRLLKSAMSEGLGDPRHDSTESLVRLYRTWAQGGIGLCVTGNVMVDRTALGEPGDVVFDDLTETDLVADWAAAAGEHQTSAWAQLNRANNRRKDRQTLRRDTRPIRRPRLRLEPERLALKHRNKTDRWRADREAAWCGCTRPTKQGLTLWSNRELVGSRETHAPS